MENKVYNAYVSLLRNELTMATGCTEPIAIAYAGAKLREVLGDIPEHCSVYCSGNMVKNVMAVTVPNSEGGKGIELAAVLGIVGGDASLDLDVLSTVTPADIACAKEMVADGCCDTELVEGVANLYIRIEAKKADQTALVEIREYHRNITRIEKNGEVLLSADEKKNADAESADLKKYLNVKDILTFADELQLEDVKEVLLNQVHCNFAIAQAGLKGGWGAEVGKTIVESSSSLSVREKAMATAAAASDARMNGCPLPVVINSGSGNQGITVSMPIYVYSTEYNIPEEIMIRALAVANLIALHEKKYIGSLSAYCGAVSAATASACGIAYMLGHGYDVIGRVITNSINTTGGMICDGAKSSCASKIATAVGMALIAFEMAVRGRAFLPGEGLVEDELEDTIASVGRMGRVGMKSTDVEILKIMLGK